MFEPKARKFGLAKVIKSYKSIVYPMTKVTLELVNKNVLTLKKELDDIKELIEESGLELTDEVKAQIEESRKRPISEFKTQEEIEKKFL